VSRTAHQKAHRTRYIDAQSAGEVADALYDARAPRGLPMLFRITLMRAVSVTTWYPGG
jgi:hypothetical protein